MDLSKCMIIDLEKRGSRQMFVTESVSAISRSRNGFLAVQFAGSTRVFNYNPSRLLYLTDPETIDIGRKGLYINNRHICNATEILRFSDRSHIFYRVTYSNGHSDNLEGNEVYITRTPIDSIGKSTWEYLRKLADETGLTTEDDENILSRQYASVDLMRDNVPLAQYLGSNGKTAVYRMPEQVFYPFGCNSSQKAAVEAALTHQVSIIQGPPGTGKTQTILNIIANLLVKGKTVLVASNNNSAVENVAEKLTREGLGFIVAQLGSVQNKEAFVAEQPDYPDMEEWKIDRPASVMDSAQRSLYAVSKGFDNQLRMARLKAEYDALSKESHYNEMLQTARPGNEWLNEMPAEQLMRLINRYHTAAEKAHKPGLWFRLQCLFSYGLKMLKLMNEKASYVIDCLESAYYVSRKAEIEKDMESVSSVLQAIDIEKNLEKLRTSSLQLLKNSIARRYGSGKRKKFTVRTIKSRSEEFLREYPVVLSTTYSATNCISRDMVFDYVIMDEASQVDIKTGALALSCAMNAVIVGDDKQLPNVISREEALALNAIRSSFNVDDRYDAATHSFLQSCLEVFKDAPVTLLREHYRCHPQIIGFCNQRFYDGELVAMTTDNGEKDVLQVIRTAPGNHARGHFNQREIDVISQEVLPECNDSESIGIITPYRAQAGAINKTAGNNLASTVHKFQGRECDTIIMSMVDNSPTEFSDDANLLNVAISRAKRKLCLVINGNEIPEESNLGQLVRYIQYNNFDVKASKLHSVFDLLYGQYTEERLAYAAKHPAISEYLSENLIYNVLLKAVSDLGLRNAKILCHYPLSRLIADWNLLEDNEKAFAGSPFSHVDFLLYNSLTKQPICAIEVDGWHFHKGNEAQQSRDALKDGILAKSGLPLLRISTTDTVNQETMGKSLSAIL